MSIIAAIAAVWVALGISAWLYVPKEPAETNLAWYCFWLPFFILIAPLFWVLYFRRANYE